jgi:hypothetical protein
MPPGITGRSCISIVPVTRKETALPVTLKRITLNAYQLLLLERAARAQAGASWMRQTDEAHRELIGMADLFKTSFSGTIDYVSDEAIEEPPAVDVTPFIGKDLDKETRQHG